VEAPKHERIKFSKISVWEVTADSLGDNEVNETIVMT
jgi:hypothetical protein